VAVFSATLAVAQQVGATGLEAKFSYRICVAMALAGLDTGALGSYTDANCAAADLCRLRDLVQVEGDGDLDRFALLLG